MSDPSAILDDLSLEGVARYIKSEKCKRIFVMTGAGISTSAGIPDFRSPETGLYANLARLNLPYPEAVFDIRFFRKNPLPFYTLAHELAPGRFRPTLSHSFIRLLHDKGLLHTCFTQNIDTLERRAGLANNKIVEAHGSFADQRCIDCKTPFDGEKMKDMIRKKEVPKCERCSGLVKPDIVFFGESLPPLFHRSITNLPSADLLIIIGTSLIVHPFASLTNLVPDSCPRVLINLEEAGDIGSRENDVIILEKCDEVVRRLSKLLQWEHELDALWDETKGSMDTDANDEEEAQPGTVEEEVQKLAHEVDKSLKLASELKAVTGEIIARQEDATVSRNAPGDAPKPDNDKEAPAGDGGKETQKVDQEEAGATTGTDTKL